MVIKIDLLIQNSVIVGFRGKCDVHSAISPRYNNHYGCHVSLGGDVAAVAAHEEEEGDQGDQGDLQPVLQAEKVPPRRRPELQQLAQT